MNTWRIPITTLYIYITHTHAQAHTSGMYDVLSSVHFAWFCFVKKFTDFSRWTSFPGFEAQSSLYWSVGLLIFVYTRLKHTIYPFSIRFLLFLMRRCFVCTLNSFKSTDVWQGNKTYALRFLWTSDESRRRTSSSRKKEKNTNKQPKCWKAYRGRETHESDMFLYVRIFMNNVVIKPQQCVFLLWYFTVVFH